jgi:hypothetical protein
MTQKRQPFITSPSFKKGAEELEKERTQRIASPSETSTGKNLTERVGEQKVESPESTAMPAIAEAPTTIISKETKPAKQKGQRQRKRFSLTIDEFVPNKYIKDDEYGTVNINQRILKEFRLFSLDAKMSVEDLMNLAAYHFLVSQNIVKDTLIKPIDFK